MSSFTIADLAESSPALLAGEFLHYALRILSTTTGVELKAIEVEFILLYIGLGILGFSLFLLDANPANAGYVCSHFVWPEDCPMEFSELLYNPLGEGISTWLTLGSWIWPNRANLKTKLVDQSSTNDSSSARMDIRKNIDCLLTFSS